MIHHKKMHVSGIEFSFSVETSGSAPVEIELAAEAATALTDTYLVRLSVRSKSGELFTLNDLSIRWDIPVIDMHGLYAGPPSPEELAKLPFWHFQKQSAA